MDDEELEEELAALRGAAMELEWLFEALDKLFEVFLVVNGDKANTITDMLTRIIEEWQFMRRPLDCRAARLLQEWRDLADSCGRTRDPHDAALRARSRMFPIAGGLAEPTSAPRPSPSLSREGSPPARSPESRGREENEDRDEDKSS